MGLTSAEGSIILKARTITHSVIKSLYAYTTISTIQFSSLSETETFRASHEKCQKNSHFLKYKNRKVFGLNYFVAF
jgi:hypothetical protein